MKTYEATEQAYKNGYADALASLVRCKDCRYWREDILRDDGEMKCCCIGMYMTKKDNFCSFGKMRGNELDDARMAD